MVASLPASFGSRHIARTVRATGKGDLMRPANPFDISHFNTSPKCPDRADFSDCSGGGSLLIQVGGRRRLLHAIGGRRRLLHAIGGRSRLLHHGLRPV
jgi:hypothetical protein